jgi:hypothetical protein
MNKRLISGTVRVVAFSAAMLLLTMLVVTRSQAAFTASTSTQASGFTAGTLELSDDDNGTSMFTATGMVPGAGAIECITVTYGGDVTPSPVRIYGASSGPLAGYLDLKIEVGTGGSSASCSGFTASSTIYDGTLSGFSGAHSNWGNAQASFTANATPFTRTFRFTATVQDTDAAQGLTATAGFTWETRSA